ncbi:MAG TPA: hypothetical protein VFZ93_04585 [Albitalea sp.]
MTAWTRAAFAAAATALCAAALGQAAPAASSVSEAERLVFVQPHLANIEAPRTLRYRYVRDGGGESRVEDDVTMAFTRSADGGCCTARGTYLTGARTVALPEVEAARANPVVLYFLEQQVRDLQRRTGGNASHFRQRIRLALANAASVSESTVRWGGRDVPARTVRITPYADDPYRARFERDAQTEYSFVLADAVPGGVWELRAALPAGGAVQTVTLVPADRR